MEERCYMDGDADRRIIEMERVVKNGGVDTIVLEGPFDRTDESAKINNRVFGSFEGKPLAPVVAAINTGNSTIFTHLYKEDTPKLDGDKTTYIRRDISFVPDTGNDFTIQIEMSNPAPFPSQAVEPETEETEEEAMQPTHLRFSYAQKSTMRALLDKLGIDSTVLDPDVTSLPIQIRYVLLYQNSNGHYFQNPISVVEYRMAFWNYASMRSKEEQLLLDSIRDRYFDARTTRRVNFDYANQYVLADLVPNGKDMHTMSSFVEVLKNELSGTNSSSLLKPKVERYEYKGPLSKEEYFLIWMNILLDKLDIQEDQRQICLAQLAEDPTSLLRFLSIQFRNLDPQVENDLMDQYATERLIEFVQWLFREKNIFVTDDVRPFLRILLSHASDYNRKQILQLIDT